MMWLTVFVGIIAFSNLILLVGLALLALTIKRMLDESVKPVLTQVKTTITDVNSMVHKIDDRTGEIMEISRDTARKVSNHITATTGIVSEAVNSPLINLASLAAGVAKTIIALKANK